MYKGLSRSVVIPEFDYCICRIDNNKLNGYNIIDILTDSVALLERGYLR